MADPTARRTSVFCRSARRLLAAGATIAAAFLLTVPACARSQSAVLGFWFEPVSYESSRLGGALTPDELHTISSIARSEITQAFAGLRVTVSDRRDASYRVRVLQHLWDPRFRGQMAIAGSSTALSRLGGTGAVNFTLLASYAESFAPDAADRAAIVAAIGRGVGRAAVHEYVHLLVGARIDEAEDRLSYEFGSAARSEQYYGALRWGGAWRELHERFGR